MTGLKIEHFLGKFVDNTKQGSNISGKEARELIQEERDDLESWSNRNKVICNSAKARSSMEINSKNLAAN